MRCSLKKFKTRGAGTWVISIDALFSKEKQPECRRTMDLYDPPNRYAKDPFSANHAWGLSRLSDTRHFHHLRRLRGSEEQSKPLDAGPATTALWKVLPIPPMSTGVHLLPPTSWLFLQCSGRVRSRLMWGGPWAWRGRALQAALGARPASRGTRPCFCR